MVVRLHHLVIGVEIQSRVPVQRHAAARVGRDHQGGARKGHGVFGDHDPSRHKRLDCDDAKTEEMRRRRRKKRCEGEIMILKAMATAKEETGGRTDRG